MAAADVPVPPGAILPTAFFAPWFDAITETDAWTALTNTSPEDWPPRCEALKARCRTLPLTTTQQRALEHLHESLAARCGETMRFAVRSSSPEEDLESASFAGGYETRLGVPLDELEDAVRHCAASSLGARVLVYKREHGFNTLAPRLAVVVQQQIDSDVAGVGFSLNPVTNDYDEAVIDANWGLGTTVVDGTVSPDHFVVNTVDRRIVEATTGTKTVSVRLDSSRGTQEQEESRAGERTLSDAQLLELTDMLCRIEALYEHPVDIEWAYANDQLHVLQARPITTHVPLPPDLITEPGEQRLLYADTGMAKGVTINAPISPMGLDWLKTFMTGVSEWLFGSVQLEVDPDESPIRFAGGRAYQNLSVLLTLVSPERLAKGFEESDSRIAEVLSTVDASRYRLPSRPSWARLQMVGVLPRFLWRVTRMIASMLWALLVPDRAWASYRHKVKEFEAWAQNDMDFSLPLDAFLRCTLAPTARHFFQVTGPAFGAAFAALQMVDRVVGSSAESKALAAKLKRGLPGNLVVEMGISLHRLAKRLDPGHFDKLSELVDRIEQRALPDAFLQDWDRFLDRWGHRGPNEMDLSAPRYADDPIVALRQMSTLATGSGDATPEAAHERLAAERRQAYETLMDRLGGGRRVLLRHLYHVIEQFGGTRDTLKHDLLLVFHAVRKRILREGRQLVDEGRLDAPEDVFNLTFDDLTAATDDPSLDLRTRQEERTCFLRRLEDQVTSFPPVIDSRGRILRPMPQEIEDGFRGMPVSPGVATGPVKVLHSADEKQIETGDVLVAVTTDPGWTPLFANAAAVVLEVGGALQHGAVVAREFGKPCVVGLDRATTLFEDGHHVEVDGTTGAVRRLDSA
jgi:pyruvate,water dikinase